MELTTTGIAAEARRRAHVVQRELSEQSTCTARVCIVGTNPVIRKTFKLLRACARGDCVVDERWLDDVTARRCFIDPYLYELPAFRVARLGVGLRGLDVAIFGPTALCLEELREVLLAAGANVVAAPSDLAASGATNGHPSVGANLRVRRPPSKRWHEVSESALLSLIVAGGGWDEPPPAADMAHRREVAEATGTEDDGLSSHADVRPSRPKRTRAASARGGCDDASQGVQLLSLPSGGDGGPGGEGAEATDTQRAREAWLLPASFPSHGSAADHFLLEDVLTLYRQRLPSCNVDLEDQPDAGATTGHAPDPSGATTMDAHGGAAASGGTSLAPLSSASVQSEQGGRRRGKQRADGGAPPPKRAAAGRGKRGGYDFLLSIVEADRARTAVLRPAEGGGGGGGGGGGEGKRRPSSGASEGRAKPLAACTFVHHPDAHLAELHLLAVSGRHARRGLGSHLLKLVEAWLRDGGRVRCAVCLAGLDTLGFWRKHGYTEEAVELPPEQWALLRDPFGSSKLVAKWFDVRQG